jgi:15-cis-phytoene synthase
MQLTNILRDVGEDLQRDRIYLPIEDLHAFNYPASRISAVFISNLPSIIDLAG